MSEKVNTVEEARCALNHLGPYDRMDCDWPDLLARLDAIKAEVHGLAVNDRKPLPETLVRIARLCDGSEDP